MTPITPDKTMGRIYQVTRKIRDFLGPDFHVVQTFGKPLPNTTLCAEKYLLKKILRARQDKSVVVFTISSFEMDEEVFSWLRRFTCTGNDVYLFTLEKTRVWFCDESKCGRAVK